MATGEGTSSTEETLAIQVSPSLTGNITDTNEFGIRARVSGIRTPFQVKWDLIRFFQIRSLTSSTYRFQGLDTFLRVPRNTPQERLPSNFVLFISEQIPKYE
jgi:hypothetical protein